MRISNLTKTLGLGALGVVLATSVASAQCPAADTFEPNDDCLTAVALANGTYNGLTVEGAAGTVNEDFFSVNVPAGDTLTVDCLFVDAVADIDVYLYDPLTSPNCGGEGIGDYLVRGFTASDNENVSWPNTSAVAVTIIVRVEIYGTVGACNDYSLVVATGLGPCSGPDDSLEPNDDCASATAVNDGTHAGLFVADGDDDYYAISVADLDTVTIDLIFLHANGDVDVELYASQADCAVDVNVGGSFSVSDNESIVYTNLSGGTLNMVIHVYHYTSSDCNDYDMVISGSGGSFAVPICFGDGSSSACPCANESTLGAGEGCKSSLGVGAILTAGGSASVAADDITFTVTQARANQPSMLVQGESLIAVPFKDGVLCMGNPTERVEVVFTDANGEGTTATSIVTNGNVSPGDTRYYQQWFRDPGGVSPCGNGSNFSNGLTVTYLP